MRTKGAAFDPALILLALALGFSLVRAKLCTVACLREWLLERRTEGVLGLAIAAGSSCLVLMGAYLAIPAAVMLPVESPALAQCALGGAILGVGALVNGGCYLGTVTYLGRGNFHYLFTLLGIGIALRLLDATPAWSTMMQPGVLRPMSTTVFIALLLALAVTVPAAFAAVRALSRGGSFTLQNPWPWPLAALLCGALAGALYARHPDWTYGTVVDALSHVDSRQFDWRASAAALALFAGAICSAVLLHRFQPTPFSPRKATRCLIGGITMACGAALIPGGNDTLLLWSIPGLTGYGLLAFATMCFTIILAVVAERRWNGPTIA